MKQKRYFLSTILALTLAGCNQTQVRQDSEPYWKAYVQDQHNSIDIIDVRESNGPAGELALAITFKNDSITQSIGQYRVEWLKANGMPVKTVMSRWTELSLRDAEVRTVSAISPHKSVSSYRLSVVE